MSFFLHPHLLQAGTQPITPSSRSFGKWSKASQTRRSASSWSLSPAAPDLRCWASRWGFTGLWTPVAPSFLRCRLCTTPVLHYRQVQQKGVFPLNGLVMKIPRLITSLKMIIFKLGGDKTRASVVRAYLHVRCCFIVHDLPSVGELRLQPCMCGLGLRSWLDKYCHSEAGSRLNFWTFAFCVTRQKAAISC